MQKIPLWKRCESALASAGLFIYLLCERAWSEWMHLMRVWHLDWAAAKVDEWQQQNSLCSWLKSAPKNVSPLNPIYREIRKHQRSLKSFVNEATRTPITRFSKGRLLFKATALSKRRRAHQRRHYVIIHCATQIITRFSFFHFLYLIKTIISVLYWN